MSMFGYSCASSCSPSDPATSTVKVDIGSLPQKEPTEAERLAEEQRQEEEIARRRAEEALLAEQRAAEERRAAREAEARRQAEEEERRLREQRDAEEKERRELAAKVAEQQRQAEAAAAAEAERQRLEQERLQEEAERKVRKEAVAAFLRTHGFSGVSKAKSSMMGMSKTYPLHKAAELGDAEIISMLLAEGAEAGQKNSSGKTAAQVAEKKDKSGSHGKVLSLLRGASTSGTVGGA
eukprot:TRINITY_DN2393_c0_g1_i1.p1 TRINITY_DN2393_c0_g1~~TRINITY_DN2393_c0_g1_i1.p1  ORF type:complete len:259 (+),score=109.18 TRINITY_DN2393_c0_g1_i1:69-779(+)